jgi:multimeric flavodoxin WrbA
MKILAISCSPRKEGNTVTLLSEALRGAQQDGAEVELYSVAGKDLRPCDGCWDCTKEGLACPIEDDMQELQDKMLAADGIIFGTPVYFYGMAAQAKTVMDRSIALGRPGRNLANKVGGIVTVCGSLGLISAVKDFTFYLLTRRMLPAGYVAAYGGHPDELKKMEKCMKAAGDLGRAMVAIVRMDFKYPLELMGRPIAYGTHTR